jgi:hypothetical protein
VISTKKNIFVDTIRKLYYHYGMARKKTGNAKMLWVLRLDPELYLHIKHMGRKAAPWVRQLMYEAKLREGK